MSEEKTLNLVQKLAKIREMVEVLRKNKQGFNYKYVTEDEIMARVAAGMKKYNVSLNPSIKHETLVVTPIHYTKTKVLKDKSTITEEVNEVIVHADMFYEWIDCDNPSDKMIIPWIMVGQQGDSSQAFGSALTYTNRYFMLKFFQIATPDDDPDRWRAKKEEAEQEADLIMVKQVITKIDAIVKQFVSASEDKTVARKQIADVVKQFVRTAKNEPSADYNQLRDLESAGKLLQKLETDFVVAST